MSTDVIMPALGMAQETGKVLGWRRGEGEPVAKGEPLMEIETDKVTVEIEAPASGILSDVSVRAGDDVPVGQVIAVIRDVAEITPASTLQPLVGDTPPRHQEGWPGSAGILPASPEAGKMTALPVRLSTSPAQPLATPVATRLAAEHELDLRMVAAAGGRIKKDDVLAHIEGRRAAPGAGRVAASPKARRLAGERGVNLALLRGSGPEGAVLSADVLAASPVAVVAPAPAAPLPPTGGQSNGALSGAPAPALPPGEVVQPSGMARLMAQRTTQSFRDTPHFYLTRELPAGRLVEARERLLPTIEARAGTRLSFTDLLIRILSQALVEHPLLNASWREGAIQMQPQVNLGVAAATPQGLLVPVIRDAATRSLAAIARERRDLARRAVAGALTPDDLAGSTTTLSNLGMYDVDMFQAIINPPHSMILAVGRIAERPVARNGAIVAAPTFWVTASFDHRIHDGARAAEFLRTFAGYVEEPLGLL